MELGNDGEMLLAGGRIRCRRCSAQSKRTKLRCGADAQACYYSCPHRFAKAEFERRRLMKLAMLIIALIPLIVIIMGIILSR